MKSVITVIGKDCVGITAKVAALCAENNVNIIDITQKVLGDLFAMIMLVDISNINKEFNSFVDCMDSLGEKEGLKIHTMHEDIFNSMHKI